MDGKRFDAISMTVGRVASRRDAFKSLVGGVLGVGAAVLGIQEASACLNPGKDCTRHGKCCSRHCRHGKCTCTTIGKACSGGSECCSSLKLECSRGDPACEFGRKQCCYKPGGRCQYDCDCCRTDNYCVLRKCGPRASTGERCGETADCRFNGEICGDNGCESGNRCCTIATYNCGHDCDCCGDLTCVSGYCRRSSVQATGLETRELALKKEERPRAKNATDRT